MCSKVSRGFMLIKFDNTFPSGWPHDDTIFNSYALAAWCSVRRVVETGVVGATLATGAGAGVAAGAASSWFRNSRSTKQAKTRAPMMMCHARKSRAHITQWLTTQNARPHSGWLFVCVCVYVCSYHSAVYKYMLVNRGIYTKYTYASGARSG